MIDKDVVIRVNRLTPFSNELKAIVKRIPYSDLRKKLGRNWERPWLIDKNKEGV